NRARFFETKRACGERGVKEKNGFAPSVKDGVAQSVKDGITPFVKDGVTLFVAIASRKSTSTREVNAGKAVMLICMMTTLGRHLVTLLLMRTKGENGVDVVVLVESIRTISE
nr:hypothetical protein [Tanacetum cinerariifolium]